MLLDGLGSARGGSRQRAPDHKGRLLSRAAPREANPPRPPVQAAAGHGIGGGTYTDRLSRHKFPDGRIDRTARRHPRRPDVAGRRARRRTYGRQRLARVRPWPAVVVRPRDAAERRLLAAGRLHGPRRLRRASATSMRLARRHAVADADHARRERGAGRSARPRGSAGAARPRGRDAGRAQRRRRLAARSRGRGPGRVRHRRHSAPRRARTCSSADPAGLRRRADCAASQPPRHYDFSRCAQTPAELRARVRAAGLAPRRRLPDPQPHAPRAHRADPARRAAGAGQPADPPRGRHDQAGRRRPLHARALLPGGAAALPGAARRSCRCCRSPCAWAGRARRCGTRSSARTTAARTSSSAATTPAPATTRTGKPFYDPYAAQELVARSTRTSSACGWCLSKRWSTCDERERYVGAERGARRRDACWTSPAPNCASACTSGPDIPDWFTFPEVADGTARAATRRAAGRASRCSSPGSPAPASPPSPTCCSSSCSRSAAGR